MHKILCYSVINDLSIKLNRSLNSSQLTSLRKISELEEFLDNNSVVDLMILEINSEKELSIVKSFQEKTQEKHNEISIIFLIQEGFKQSIESTFQSGVDFLLLPVSDYELSLRIKLNLKKIEMNRKYKSEYLFNQYILDAQQNIIFIHDDKGVVDANKSFYEFFQIKSIQEFKKRYGNLIDLFMEYENYFSYHIVNDNKSWVNSIEDKKSTNYNVLLMNYNTFEPETFLINVNAIPNSDKFVVTLTNITDLTRQSKEFELKANYDSLTGIYNRNKFNEFLEKEYSLFKRYKNDTCLAILDIDFFKQVNDNYGHLTGDDLLIKFTKLVNDNIRNTDIFARWGGEEFTLLLPNTSIENGVKVVENLKDLVSQVKFKTVGKKTCSIGVTQFKDDDTSMDDIFQRADEALYEAKNNGRNKVCKR